VNAALWVLAAALVAVGTVGVILPVLPGAWLVFAGLAVGAWIDGFVYVGPWTLAALGLLALASAGVDLAASALGARRAGAHPRAIVGAAVGAVAGLFFGLVGVVLGPFIGAVLGEISAQSSLERAGQVGLATWLGMLLGGAAKLAIVLTMLGIFAIQRFL